MVMPYTYLVRLSDEQRKELEAITKNSDSSPREVNRAKVLLMSDHNQRGGRMTRTQISGKLGIHENTVDRIRKDFHKIGIDRVHHQTPADPPNKPVFDGETEARVIAVACSEPPDGRSRWTIQLLTEKIISLQIVPSSSKETVRKVLHQNELKPWLTRSWCFPEHDNARFVADMEDVLDIYQKTYTDKHVLVCMDEASKQLLDDVVDSVEASPGHDRKVDYHYIRGGVRPYFMFFNPIQGWRRVSIRKRRTAVDWAEEIHVLLYEDYPEAEKITLVCDHLNTHVIASLYKRYPAQKAREMAKRLDIHYTPRKGSWLNIAEIELSVAARQCLNRRISSEDDLANELTKWAEDRNQAHRVVNWQFTTEDARVKLRHFYPRIND